MPVQDDPTAMIFENIAEGAPERKAELTEYWEKYAPTFVVVDDRPGYFMEAGAFGSVLFTHRTMLQIWLVGFALWRAVEAYSGILWLLDITRTPFNAKEISNLEEQGEADAAFDKALEIAVELGGVSDVDRIAWPTNVPRPATSETLSKSDEAVTHLNCIATAYVFLHEVKHVMFSSDANAPSDPILEEEACDIFARDFLFHRVAEYAQTHGVPATKVLEKRALGLLLAAFVIIEVTPVERWCGSATHPAVVKRMRSVLATADVPNDSTLWLVASALLLSKMRNMGHAVEEIRFEHSRDLFERLAQRLSA